jgi:hypothetical protein
VSFSTQHHDRKDDQLTLARLLLDLFFDREEVDADHCSFVLLRANPTDTAAMGPTDSKNCGLNFPPSDSILRKGLSSSTGTPLTRLIVRPNAGIEQEPPDR